MKNKIVFVIIFNLFTCNYYCDDSHKSKNIFLDQVTGSVGQSSEIKLDLKENHDQMTEYNAKKHLKKRSRKFYSNLKSDFLTEI